jgi:restriction endonuclease Mrr
MTAPAEIPAYHELLWPALLAMDELGGSASIGEMEETVVKRERFTDGQLSVLHNDGPPTEIGYRLAWARTYLKGIGLLTNSARGVWTVTDAGTALLNDRSIDDRAKREHVRALWAGYQAERRRTDRGRRQRKQVRAAGAAPATRGRLRQRQRHREKR